MADDSQLLNLQERVTALEHQTQEPSIRYAREPAPIERIDPTLNVKELMQSSLVWLDKIRNLETKRLDDLRDAEKQRQDDLRQLRTDYEKQIASRAELTAQALAERVETTAKTAAAAVAATSEASQRALTASAEQTRQALDLMRNDFGSRLKSLEDNQTSFGGRQEQKHESQVGTQWIVGIMLSLAIIGSSFVIHFLPAAK